MCDMFLNYGKTIFFLQLIPEYDMVTVEFY
jgi:hypothetical protein